jgi:phosphate transport system substrate-binding protein
MRKRLISIFAALILFISALSACTRGESSVTPEETTEALDPTTPKPTETDPPETSPSETEPSESTPQETEPIDPDTLMFTPENYPKVDGSTATKPLAKAFQEALTGEKDVEINHSKTGKAYTKLVDGEVDLILVVEPSEDNKAYADEKKVTLKLSKVANEGFVFFVNKRNPVNSLTADQIRKIYSGEITNWKEVGGLDAEIVAFQRPVNSGSQTGMESIVMGDTPLTEPVTERIAGSMEDIIDVISAFDGGENAIGYSYYYYANTMYLGENIKMIGVDGIMPNNTTICDMEYPFLTAYYAVTREGDESDRTKDLLNYMLSEYGQKDVLKAGYVPIFDVGSAPSDGKEASDERTIHLSDTYDRAAIQVTEVTEERNGSQFMCLEIDGLRDITVQEKVNQALRENSENAFAEAMKKTDGMSDKAKVYLNARLIGAFSDILSVEVSVTTDDGAGNWYNDYAPVNLKLSDGEVIRFHDLFKTDTEGKDIFNATAYSRILSRIAVLTYGSYPESYSLTIEDYNDVEDLMLDLIVRYNAGEDIPFTVTPGAVTIFTKVKDHESFFTLHLEDFMEEVTLFSKFPAESDLYTGDYRAAKNIPVLISQPYADYGILEVGENYYLNFALRFDLINEGFDSYEEAYRFFDQRAEYLRAEFEEARKAGKYILYEAAFNIHAQDGEYKIGGTGELYQVSGSNQFIRIVLDSREEFETACEKLLAAWRSEQGEGEPGLYTRGMYAFIWNSGETFPYEYQDEFENLYLLYGYQALRPIKVNRVRLSDLDGKSGQEALEMLKAKSLELPEIYAKKGNEAQVVSMVLAELRQDPELLKTRAWTYTDPTLYEAAERIADCIYP